MDFLKRPDDVVYSLCDYHPWRGGFNPKTDRNSRLIMDLKSSSYSYASSHFSKILSERLKGYEFPDGILQVAIVPSSQSNKVGLGLVKLVSELTHPGIVYNKDFLVRYKTVSKSHISGDRSLEKHLDSINNQAFFNLHAPFLIIDDVVTSESSLRACQQILKSAGAEHVVMLAIGCTK